MKLDPEETILLTQEEYERMLAICAAPPKITPALLEAIKKSKGLFKDETKRINELCTDPLAPTYYVRRYLNACKKRKLDEDDK
jgi:hypothetical protein